VPSFRPRFPPGIDGAFWVAAVILVIVELALHSEAVLHRYASVFAVGRAIDKLKYVETYRPGILFVGNSRTDNGVDPRTVSRSFDGGHTKAFNLGMPGANSIVYHGELARLDSKGLLGPDGIHTVVFGLDENSLWEENTVGYIQFLGDRQTLWDEGRLRDWMGTWVRIWSYSANLRELREPKDLIRFFNASLGTVDPVGGAAAAHLGYRRGFGESQNAAQIQRQRETAPRAPATSVSGFFLRSVDLLQRRGVRVVVTFFYDRGTTSAYFSDHPAARPYREFRNRLIDEGVVVLPLQAGLLDDEFINDGHLNDKGAQRYSAELGRQLSADGVR
jgi:hypothetical protein